MTQENMRSRLFWTKTTEPRSLWMAIPAAVGPVLVYPLKGLITIRVDISLISVYKWEVSYPLILCYPSFLQRIHIVLQFYFRIIIYLCASTALS